MDIVSHENGRNTTHSINGQEEESSRVDERKQKEDGIGAQSHELTTKNRDPGREQRAPCCEQMQQMRTTTVAADILPDRKVLTPCHRHGRPLHRLISLTTSSERGTEMAVTTDSGDNRQPAAAAGSGNRLIRVIRSRFDHCPVESKNFLPYQYQTMLYEIAKNKNTIICMSTGTGKTFIAIMLLKELSYQIRSDDPFDPNSSSGPKRSVFLVPTRPLVYQHAKSIRGTV